MFNNSIYNKKKKKNPFWIAFFIIVVIILCIFLWISSVILPPTDFPVPYQFVINKGESLFTISNKLYNDKAIKNKRVFEILMISLGSERKISEGEYLFSKPVSLIDVALRLSGNRFGINRTKITFPEGFSNEEIANRIIINFPLFDKKTFINLAQPYEGYLFPDTYNFFPSVSPQIVIYTLQNTFDTKTSGYKNEALKTGKNWNDIITMASIIEKEAKGENDRKIISGILWKRISIGMPLQVDAPFLYLLGKKSSDLTKSDLSYSSPYNTYINKGLPPTPINNPGLATIEASLHPTVSDYIFYIHDRNGDIHYAKTFKEHSSNIKKYLN